MQSDPRQFNLQRIQKNKTGGVIKSRIAQILLYVIDCYLTMLNDNPTFSISEVNKYSTYKVEDYLSNRFVDDYLQKRKLQFFSGLTMNQIIFSKQSSENYLDCNTHKEQPDLIDIYVTNIQLDKELSTNPQPYFAIECKRIRKPGSFDEYISDIKKFSDRIHSQTRLPYEGQIAFIENPSYTHFVTADNINRKLQSHKTIKTKQFLESVLIHQHFNGSYYSKHLRNYGDNNVFAIYHLMFDYTKIVVA